MTAAASEPSEAAMVRTILLAARVTHWRVAHFRPALTKWGYRTAVQGDGAGFPDLVMVHRGARLVWWVELKSAAGRLEPDQRAWKEALEEAGAVWLLVRGKVGLDRLTDEMARTQEMAKARP